MTSAPTQAEELRNTVPVRYLPYRPNAPRRLPYQNRQQLHVADVLTIISAANKQQYEQRLPPATVRDLIHLVCSNEFIRRFFRDAFWWLYLMHFSEIDLDLLLNVAQKNVLLSSADAALMSMDAIRKRTNALAPKAPPQTALNSSQRRQLHASNNSSGRRNTLAASNLPSSPRGLSVSASAESAHDQYRQRMVSLANDTLNKIHAMKATEKTEREKNGLSDDKEEDREKVTPKKPKTLNVATMPSHLSPRVANRTTQQLAHIASPSTVDTKALAELVLNNGRNTSSNTGTLLGHRLPTDLLEGTTTQPKPVSTPNSASKFASAQRKEQMQSFTGQNDTDSENESPARGPSPSSTKTSPTSPAPLTTRRPSTGRIVGTNNQIDQKLPTPLLPSALITSKDTAKERQNTPPKLTFVFGDISAPDPQVEGDAFEGFTDSEAQSDDDDDELEDAMAVRTFGATLLDTEDDADEEDGSTYDNVDAPRPSRLVPLDELSKGGAQKKDAKTVEGINISKIPTRQREQVVQAEHHKLFCRMAMNYGQLLMGLIYSSVPHSEKQSKAGLGSTTSSSDSPRSTLGRFESRIQRDAIIGFLPDLLAQGLHLTFALALPFVNATLLDADFQLSILRHLTFWIHGIESTQRFVLGSTITLSNLSSPTEGSATKKAGNSPKKDLAAIASSASQALSPPASPATVLSAVSLPRVGSLAATQRRFANPTIAAQDARAYKSSASVSSWPANAIITIIHRRRKEFWQQVKEGTAHPVTDYPKCTLESLRLKFKSSKRRHHKPKSPIRSPPPTDDATIPFKKGPQSPSIGSLPNPLVPQLIQNNQEANALPAFSIPKNPDSPYRNRQKSPRKSGNGDVLAMSAISFAGTATYHRHLPHPPPIQTQIANTTTKEEIIDRQVMAFCREIQRVHTTHTFASANNMLPQSEDSAGLGAPPKDGKYIRNKNAVGAASHGMDTFLDNLAQQQRRESQNNSSPKGNRPNPNSKAAASQLLAMNGIDVSGQISTIRNVHVIKKELDEKHQPVAPWYMRPEDRIRKKTGQLYYLLNGGNTTGPIETHSGSGRNSPEGTPRKDGSKSTMLSNGPNAPAPMAQQSSTAARFTLTNWSPLIQRYLLLQGSKNNATPESMGWTLPQV